MINFDLESTPLEIKTDSVAGSSEKVEINFFNQQDDYAGGVKISFTSPPTYYLKDCSVYPDNTFHNTPTTDVNKLWRITVTKTSDTRNFVIQLHCNDAEVLNVLLSDTVCAMGWSTYWNRDVTKINFSVYDTASDFYKTYTPGGLSVVLQQQQNLQSTFS